MANMTNNLSIKNGKNAGKNVGSKSKGRGMAGDPGKSMPSQAFPGPKVSWAAALDEEGPGEEACARR